MKETISKVIHTLNLITVCGKENMDMLLGCILVLEQALAKTEDVPTVEIEEANE